MQPIEHQLELFTTLPDGTPLGDAQTPQANAAQSAVSTPGPARQRPQRLRRIWPWLLIVPAFLGVSIPLGRLLLPSRTTAQLAPQGPPPKPVTIASLKTGEAKRTIRLNGQVEATKNATIRAQTSGVVVDVLVQAGDRVSAGTVVAVLDDTDQRLLVSRSQAQLAQEQSQLAQLTVGTRQEILAQRQARLRSSQAREQEAMDNLRRTQDLVAEGALSERALVEARAAVDAAKSNRLEAAAALAEAEAGPIREEIDAQRANVNAAQAAVEQANVSLSRTQVRSVADAVVQARQVSVGDYVEESDPIVTLVAEGTVDVFLEVPEDLSSEVRPGAQVTLTARALQGWQRQAQITGVVPMANATSRRRMVRVRLDNAPEGLLPGMAVQGELTIAVPGENFVVPRDALSRRGSDWLLFAVGGTDSKQAKEFKVNLVADMGETVAIRHPELKSGMTIVVKGGDSLREGAPIKVVDP